MNQAVKFPAPFRRAMHQYFATKARGNGMFPPGEKRKCMDAISAACGNVITRVEVVPGVIQVDVMTSPNVVERRVCCARNYRQGGRLLDKFTKRGGKWVAWSKLGRVKRWDFWAMF